MGSGYRPSCWPGTTSSKANKKPTDFFMSTLSSDHAGSWPAEQVHAADVNVLNLIRSKFPREVNELLAREEAKTSAIAQEDSLAGAAHAKRNTLANAERDLAGLETVDFAQRIFESMKSTGRPARVIAAEISHYALLAETAPKILQLARQDAVVADKRLLDFQRENKELLAEAHVEIEARRQAYQASIQSEQEEAAQRRQQETTPDQA